MASLLAPTPAVAPVAVPAAPPAVAAPWRPRTARALLVGGTVAATALVLGAVPQAGLADAELTRLMQLMALVKATLVVAALGALWWRTARPVAPGRLAAYTALAWCTGAALAAMWRMVLPGTVAVVLHGAGLALLLLAWRDPDFLPRPAAARPGARR